MTRQELVEACLELHAEHEKTVAELDRRRDAEAELRQAEAKYRAMFENSTDGMFQTTVDGQYLACNRALASIYGYESPDELRASVGSVARQLYVEPGTRDRFVQLMREHDAVSGFEARIFRKDGSIIWITETARCVRDDAGDLLYYEGFVSNITARKAAEDKLRESEERYALSIRGANDGVWDWNLRTGQIHFSSRWKQLVGCGDDEIGTLPEEWFNRIHPDDVESVKAAIAAHRDDSTEHFRIEHRMKTADGTYRWMLARGTAVYDSTGKATRMAGSQTDIHNRKLAEEQMLRDAMHDGLTGLPNRALFTDRLERSIARMARDESHQFAVLFLDLDRFKVINDSLGHGVGDQLLIDFAKRLNTCVRPSDTIARLGGDEFTILIEDPHQPDDAISVAERILAELKTPFMLGTHEIFISTSIGIAASTAGYTKPQDVLRDADTAMYRAKALGKSRYQAFDSDMHARAMRQLQVENDLRRAIDRGEFELHYQPIQNINTRHMSGFEALIRWQHPERGLVSPADFISIAEETGLIIPIGHWVLLEACRQCAAWHAQFPQHKIDINVNLSGRQFSQADLIEQVTSVLRQTKLPANHLILEITESVVMENPEATITMLHGLKTLGVKLNIDDFGTGYSSLAYLQRFPVDTMKIDRSFINRINDNPENAEIVKTIIALAHNLNMKVTAEGIETAEQLTQLKGLNCENAQGYFLSRPLDSGTATALMKSNNPVAADQAA